MIPNMNLSEAKPKSIEPGGYIVRVLGTEIDAKYNRLILKVDITEGPNQGYYTRLEEQYNFWGLYANLYLDEDSKWKFANAIEAFRESNVDFEWENDAENDEAKLVGMYVGAILQRKHYVGNDGKEKTKLQVHHLVPRQDIDSKTFKIPDDVYKDGTGASAPAVGGVVDMTAAFGPVDDTPF